jgi:hypothetical protein
MNLFLQAQPHTPCGSNLGGFQAGKQLAWLFNIHSLPTFLCVLEKRWEDKEHLNRMSCKNKLSTISVSDYYVVLFDTIQKKKLNNFKMRLLVTKPAAVKLQT